MFDLIEMEEEPRRELLQGALLQELQADWCIGSAGSSCGSKQRMISCCLPVTMCRSTAASVVSAGFSASRHAHQQELLPCSILPTH